MPDLTTLGKVRERVDQLAQNHWDDFVPVEGIMFDGIETVHLGNNTYPLKPVAQREIACRLGIPYPYLQRCDPELQAANLNRWMSEEKNKKLFFRFDGDEVRAVFTPRYKPIDHPAVMNRLDELGFSSDTPVQCRLDDELLFLNIPNPEQSFCPKPGDEMRPGISIANSEVGMSSLTLSAFILRLVCTNGMVSRTSVDASYRHVSNRILDEFPRTLERVSNDVNRQRDRWTISTESPVDDPPLTLKSFNKQYHLGKKEIDAVEWAWPQEAGDRMFHIVNTYTRAAQHNGLSADESYHLQRVGGSVLAMLN